MRNYINTLDLDNYTKEKLDMVIEKIKKCPNYVSHKIDDSAKGYHVKFLCNKTCDICRFVFDDDKRYAIDFKKPEIFKNIMFDEKVYFEKKTTPLELLKKRKKPSLFCDRCNKYLIKTELQSKELEINEVKEKMRIGKIRGYPHQLVYLGFTYFECPVCHWFKFVKNTELKETSQ